MERTDMCRAGAATVVIVLCLTWATAASAQSQQSQGPFAALLTTGILGTTAGGTGVTISVMMSNSDGGEEQSKTVFLRRHRLAIERSLAVGGGEGVRALADVFGVARDARSVFARMLRERRGRLLPLLRAAPIASAQASVFFRRVATGMRQTRELRGDWRKLDWTSPEADASTSRVGLD